MENKIEPTQKHKTAFKKIVEDGGKKGESMIKAGYSKNTAKTPTKMTKTKGWEQLLKQYLPDKKLAEVHSKLLKHKDWRARDSGLDKGYKLKGKYTPEKVEHSGEIATIVTEAELAEYIKWRKGK